MKLYKNKEWLHEQYCVKGKSAGDIGRDSGVGQFTIFNWAKKFGLKRKRPILSRPQRRKYKLNENYFEDVSSERVAYWLGFIAADGCVMNRPGKRILSIELSEKDESHLLKFKKDMEYTGPLYYKKARIDGGNSSVHLQLCSPKLILDLIKHGIVERKSLILEPPLWLRKDLIRHWIRGLFDGDGSVSSVRDGHIRGQFFGTENVIRFIVKNIPGTKTVTRHKDCNGFYHSFLANKKMYNYLYYQASIYLARKEEIFKLV